MRRQPDPRSIDETPESVAAQSAPPVPEPPAAATILGLQRTVGNHAVGAMLARNGVAPAAAKTPSDLYEDAVKAADWDKAAEQLCKVEWAKITDKLTQLTPDELRLLDDGLSRSAANPLKVPLVRAMVSSTLVNVHHVDEKKAAPGGAFGEIKIDVTGQKNGTASDNYEYEVEITFKPDKAACKADQIAFIQRVRLVDTATGANKDWDATNKKRATKRQSSIDRINPREQGWYGFNDDENDGSNVKSWRRANATPDHAWMYDGPNADIPNTTWEFETAAVSRAGPDVGMVYATVTWGFTVDNALKLTPLPNKVFNKPTTDLVDAVAAWNAQAAGPAADRNAPNQKSLPTLK